ncbi:MAG: UbiD family decarboxylase, partial [Chloroflexota bacterium]|nr:UbiD family decarboxylase [Chloroflexota bacterium]
GRRNVGMYRLQVFDRNTTGMHWHIHKDGSHFFNEYVKAGKRMEVAVAIGTDPATTYAATAPMPMGIDEMMLAGFIRHKTVPMVKCLTVDMEVPAEAEFVLEGYVDPGELRREGPFGDHTGYYSLVDDYPVFHVTAVTHKREAVYSATVVGRPPMEDCYLAKATERLFLPLLKMVMPEIRDYFLPWEGVFHNIVVASIAKEYPGQARKVMHGLWGQGQMSFCKAIVVVDEGLDITDYASLMNEFMSTLDVNTDVMITSGILDVLDHSAPEPLYGGKIGIDLTSRVKGELARTSNLEGMNSLSKEDLIGQVQKIIGEDGDCRIIIGEANNLLLVSVGSDGVSDQNTLSSGFLDSSVLAPFSLFIVYDHDVDLTDDSLLLWKLFNNTDPIRDILIANNRVVINARKKDRSDQHQREWPDDIVMTEEVIEGIRQRGIEDILRG